MNHPVLIADANPLDFLLDNQRLSNSPGLPLGPLRPPLTPALNSSNLCIKNTLVLCPKKYGCFAQVDYDAVCQNFLHFRFSRKSFQLLISVTSFFFKRRRHFSPGRAQKRKKKKFLRQTTYVQKFAVQRHVRAVLRQHLRTDGLTN